MRNGWLIDGEGVRSLVEGEYRRAGMPPVEAAAYIADIIRAMLAQKKSGHGLQF